MATTDFIAAIELGSSKAVGVAGRKNSDGSMQVLAYVQEDSSSFMRKGVVFNLDRTTQCLKSIVSKLEKELKSTIARVYVSIGGQSLHVQHNVVSREWKEEEIISEKLVSAIGDENLSVLIPDMAILDVVPQEYKVGNSMQANPVGLVGNRMEGHFLNILIRSSVRKNWEYCFSEAKIEIADLLIAPVVTANAVLTESERRSGCALVDFGADTTTIIVYKNNILRFLAVLPLGGNSITRDIATLRFEEDEAERLKKDCGDALYEEADEETTVVCSGEDDRKVDLIELNEAVGARAEEIVANVWNQIQLSGYESKLLGGLVLTGGAAGLKNIDTLIRRYSKIEKIRTATKPREEIRTEDLLLTLDGTQNTVLGLLFEGDLNCCSSTAERPNASGHETDESYMPDMFKDYEDLENQPKGTAGDKLKSGKQNSPTKSAKKPVPKKPGWLEKIQKTIFSDEEETLT